MTTPEELKELGLTLIENYITPEKEQEILSQLKKSPKKATTYRNTMRRFGSKHPYPLEPIADEKLPEFLEFYCNEFVERGLLKEEERPDSITINEYHQGQSIGFHIDSPGGGPVITVLSLLSTSVLNFRNEAEKRTLGVTLQPRSLLQIRDKIRYEWQHGTSAARASRYSIVFRKGTYIPGAHQGSYV